MIEEKLLGSSNLGEFRLVEECEKPPNTFEYDFVKYEKL